MYIIGLGVGTYTRIVHVYIWIVCAQTYTPYTHNDYLSNTSLKHTHIHTHHAICNSITYIRTCTHIMCVDLEKNPRRQCWCQTESVDTQMAKRNAIASMSTYTRTNARFHMPAQNYYAVMQDECK